MPPCRRCDAPRRPSLSTALAELLQLADKTLEMPEQVTRFLGRDGNAVDINRAIIETLREIAPPREITVETNLQDNLPDLALYSFDIVIQNLLRNAIDAMPDGGQLSIATSLVSPEKLAGYVQLSVKDTGVGIPSEIRPHIFELNFTTKRSKGKGLGLGLWWVRAFVRRSGGEISVESKRGLGSEFSIKIPISAPGAILVEPGQ